MSGESTEPTFPCKLCGPCKKLTKMQRKVFDSGKQRAANSDVPYKDIKKAAKDKEKHGGVFPRPATHWRERHEDFINAVSASKHVKEALKTGKPLPPPPKSAVNSDYICCVHCGRNFNEKAADRHIAFCKEQTQRKGTSGVATRSSSTGRSGVKNSTATAATPSNTSSRANRPPSRRSSKERPRPMV
uniref:Zinc finger C2HC domain-containing protein 1B n=1 Tax=Ditylenchus dipsaci TaxID=166011 RepID=A0A915CNM1_9BILA